MLEEKRQSQITYLETNKQDLQSQITYLETQDLLRNWLKEMRQRGNKKLVSMFGTLKIGKQVVKFLPRLGRLGEEYVFKKKIRKFHFYVFIKLKTLY